MIFRSVKGIAGEVLKLTGPGFPKPLETAKLKPIAGACELVTTGVTLGYKPVFDGEAPLVEASPGGNGIVEPVDAIDERGLTPFPLFALLLLTLLKEANTGSPGLLVSRFVNLGVTCGLANVMRSSLIINEDQFEGSFVDVIAPSPSTAFSVGTFVPCDWPRPRYGRLRCLFTATLGGGGRMIVGAVELFVPAGLFAFCPSKLELVSP